MNINTYIGITNFKQFFSSEKYKNFARIKFSRSAHCEYFPKLFRHFFSQNLRNRQKLIL